MSADQIALFEMTGIFSRLSRRTCIAKAPIVFDSLWHMILLSYKTTFIYICSMHMSIRQATHELHDHLFRTFSPGKLIQINWYFSTYDIIAIGSKITRNIVVSIWTAMHFLSNVSFKQNHLIYQLTHWGRVTHICVGKLTNIGSDNGLSPGRRQAIIWTNAGILLMGPLGTNFGEFLIVIHTFSFNKMHLKMSSANGVHFVSASIC